MIHEVYGVFIQPSSFRQKYSKKSLQSMQFDVSVKWLFQHTCCLKQSDNSITYQACFMHTFKLNK